MDKCSKFIWTAVDWFTFWITLIVKFSLAIAFGFILGWSPPGLLLLDKYRPPLPCKYSGMSSTKDFPGQKAATIYDVIRLMDKVAETELPLN